MFDHLDIVMAKSMFSADFANKLWTLNFVVFLYYFIYLSK